MLYFYEKKINHVTKVDNPPNVPELRPIKDFWNILKEIVYANNWLTTDPDQHGNRINYRYFKKIELVKETL